MKNCLRASLFAGSLALVCSTGCVQYIGSYGGTFPGVNVTRRDANLVLVIKKSTLDYSSKLAFCHGGLHNTWYIFPGHMLLNVADAQLPQMVDGYEVSRTYREPPAGKAGLVVELGVTDYEFCDFGASISVHATVYGKGKVTLLEKNYTEQGPKYHGRIFWGGQHVVIESVRDSSFTAYRQILEALGTDIADLLAQQ